MSEATAGVPEANASVSTMPKLSPPSDGAQSRSASPSRRHFSSSVTAAGHVHALRVEQQRLDLLRGHAGDRQARGHAGVAQRLEGAQQHRQPLAALGTADEEDLEVVAGRVARAGRR